LGKIAHFSYFNPTGFFVKRDKLLSKLIKLKYENIKFKKKNVKRDMSKSKPDDKILKTPSKSHENIPLNEFLWDRDRDQEARMVEDMAWDPHLALTTPTSSSTGSSALEEEGEEPVLSTVRILGPEEPVRLERPAVNKNNRKREVVGRAAVDKNSAAEDIAEDGGEKGAKSSCYKDFTPYLPEIKVCQI
jgi:hypothetical protein